MLLVVARMLNRSGHSAFREEDLPGGDTPSVVLVVSLSCVSFMHVRVCVCVCLLCGVQVCRLIDDRACSSR